MGIVGFQGVAIGIDEGPWVLGDPRGEWRFVAKWSQSWQELGIERSSGEQTLWIIAAARCWFEGKNSQTLRAAPAKERRSDGCFADRGVGTDEEEAAGHAASIGHWQSRDPG